MKTFLRVINTISRWEGRIVSILIFPLIFVVLYEVIARYVFNRPTIWAHEVSAHLFGTFVMLGGVYTLHLAAHVNVDIVYSSLSLRGRAILDLISWAFFYIFIGVMTYQGILTATRSWAIVERSQSAFAIPMYPLKTVIVIGAFLMLLQGLAKTVRDVFIAITGREIE